VEAEVTILQNQKSSIIKLVLKEWYFISVATPLPTLQKKLLAQFLEKTRTLRNLRQ
jgi:hypothetical protein